jgi:tripartite-type tricarboxylate transporter receptor subunit TctC
MRTLRSLALSAAIIVLSVLTAKAQDYPTQPITIITLPAGGGADFGARLIAQGLTEELHQPVIVENRANGPISSDLVRTAASDGYTLLYTGSAHWLYALMEPKATYDPVADYSPVALATRTPSILVVNPSVPVNNVAELIAYAKANPGVLNFGSGGMGSSYHLAGELFKSMAGIDIVHVPYGGGGPAVLGLLSNEVQILFAPGGSVLEHIKANKVKALGVASASRSALVPDLPTIAESGLPGYSANNLNGFFAPANTPASVVARLNEAIVTVLKREDVKSKFAATGVETVGSSPDEFAEAVKSDMVTMGKVIEQANIHPD